MPAGESVTMAGATRAGAQVFALGIQCQTGYNLFDTSVSVGVLACTAITPTGSLEFLNSLHGSCFMYVACAVGLARRLLVFAHVHPHSPP